MSTRSPTIGTCPECGTSLPEHRILIEYERDGRDTAYVECPGCWAVVNPAPAAGPLGPR